MSKPNQTHTAGLPGLVISYFGSSVAVEVEDGQVLQCHLKRNQELPVVGDRVRVSGDTIDSIEPRHSQLSRGTGHGKSKVIAANIDAILIVMAPPPVFSEYLIDRYAVAAELLNIQPILVVNKMDLLTNENRSDMDKRLQSYRDIPYPVVMSSIYSKDGLSELAHHVKDKTAVLVGCSGVGKSSIIAGCCPQDEITVGEVSAKGAGKHTTTATRLYHLPGGGQLIDSPGVREFNLWEVQRADVLKGFREFQQYSNHNSCKFRDCTHLVEPGCAVQAAVQDGKISASRFESYQKLMKEAVNEKKY